MLLLLHLSTSPPPPPSKLTSLSSPNSAALLSHSSINPFTLSFSNSPPLISTTKPKPFSSLFCSSCHSSAHHESSALFPSPLIAENDHVNNNNNGNCGGGNSGGGGGGGGGGEFSGFGFPSWDMALYWLLIHGNNRNRKRVLSYFLLFFCFQIPAAMAKTENPEIVWEVRGGKWRRLVPDAAGDSFVVDSVLGGGIERKDQSEKEGKSSKGLISGSGVGIVVRNCVGFCKEFVLGLMLPEGYPQSVSSDYLEYCLWRGVQGVASQINGVLTTQALLYAVGLGKGAIPTAAAISWVLKDGIGYLSKIFLSKFGRHFDVHPKGWRLFADLLENAAYGLELLTPTFPEFFVVIGSVAGASRSAASLIQAATRSCFYAGFAAQRNFAEVIAKGEAQGMVSKSVGIVLGIALANCVSSSGTLTALSFSVVSVLHMICNVKSYQSIQLRNLNPLRASLFFSEYLISGSVPSVREVNDNEPLFPGFPVFMMRTMHQGQVLSEEAKGAAARIHQKLQLGSKLSEVVDNAEEALALFNLFKDEGYIVTECKGLYHVVLKEGSSPEDMLKSLFLINYMNWLERRMGMDSRGTANDCGIGGKLRLSYEYVQREFNHVKHAGKTCGWDTDGLVARPLPYKIRIG